MFHEGLGGELPDGPPLGSGGIRTVEVDRRTIHGRDGVLTGRQNVTMGGRHGKRHCMLMGVMERLWPHVQYNSSFGDAHSI